PSFYQTTQKRKQILTKIINILSLTNNKGFRITHTSYNALNKWVKTHFPFEGIKNSHPFVLMQTKLTPKLKLE
ncbi:hypothetical protein, partial [Dyella mobilis]|uniref:hypothetical protein n=1 Tax=Dyella mobilis TaxID=1849582 RepID=UPI0024E11171